MEREKVMEIFSWRHACKEFDREKKINKLDLLCILDAGRLSPSSFGLEQWKFLILDGQELKEKLQESCYGQKQVGTASNVIVILAKRGLYDPGNPHVEKMFKRWNLPDEVHEGFLGFHKMMAAEFDLDQWAIAQCHIAAANMMTAAAMIGIDSCPLGGFQAEGIKEVLGIDGEKYEVALVLPLGYRLNSPGEKVRLPLEEVAQFVEV